MIEIQYHRAWEHDRHEGQATVRAASRDSADLKKRYVDIGEVPSIPKYYGQVFGRRDGYRGHGYAVPKIVFPRRKKTFFAAAFAARRQSESVNIDYERSEYATPRRQNLSRPSVLTALP